MPLKDLLKKKDRLSNDEGKTSVVAQTPETPEFKFLRTDTYSQEVIEPPAFAGDRKGVAVPPRPLTPPDTPQTSSKLSLGRLRKGSNTSPSPGSPKEHKRLSQRLHLGSKSGASSTSSVNIPADLPTITDPYSESGDKQEKEAKWEERATILARENVHSRPPTAEMSQMSVSSADAGSHQRSHSRSRSIRSIGDVESDVNIQEAIRLHEAGELTKATEMFGRLAETGNVLSQVLYGLSLRHGWGCTPDTARAVTYLSAAASNSASIESEALAGGMKKGGAAKGELVLAIFELANCFRNGWGVEVDKVAARQYYETAANLGDTDAMNEAAWCYLEGFGGKKDKVSLSTYSDWPHNGQMDNEHGPAQACKSIEPAQARAVAGQNHVQSRERFSLTHPISGRSIPLRFHHITEAKPPPPVEEAKRSPRQTVTVTASGYLRFPIGHVAIMSKIPSRFPELHFGQQCMLFQPLTSWRPLH
jgi:TPR repeat protein